MAIWDRLRSQSAKIPMCLRWLTTDFNYSMYYIYHIMGKITNTLGEGVTIFFHHLGSLNLFLFGIIWFVEQSNQSVNNDIHTMFINRRTPLSQAHHLENCVCFQKYWVSEGGILSLSNMIFFLRRILRNDSTEIASHMHHIWLFLVLYKF